MDYDIEIDFAPALDEDLARLSDSNPTAHARWLTLINELYDQPALAYELTLNRGAWTRQPRFDTVPLGVFLAAGYNISRVKLYDHDLRPYSQRLLYALEHQGLTPNITLLGLLPRKTAYDNSDPTVARILADYDRLGVPRIPRG